MTVSQLLGREALLHPLSRAADLYKLLYQRFFGPGHMVDDPEIALAYLRQEADCPRRPLPLTESLGNDLVRLNLDSEAFPPGLEAAAAGCFVHTANRFTADPAGFREALRETTALLGKGDLPWDGEAFTAYIRGKEAEGWPAVRHSPAYREAYAPRYRVIDAALAAALPAVEALLRAAAAPRGILAIDGRCGSGKTTLAATLSGFSGWPVVPMDDFFLPFPLRTKERLSAPGGNVHYERLEAEVLAPFQAGGQVTYSPFDCGTGEFDNAVTLPQAEHLLLEGSYSHHPALRKYIASFVFVTAAPETQRARLAKRDPQLLNSFITQWIPMEEAYFSAYPPPEGCVTIHTDKEE